MKRGPGLEVRKTRLAAVMWPTAKSIISCTRRLDDGGNTVGVAGPCHRLEAGEAQPQKVLSWATLGRFDNTPPDTAPLADQLHGQAMSLRRDARRRIEERAARAAPKIQLVVALVLVPSVLLMMLAALIAHADALLGAV